MSKKRLPAAGLERKGRPALTQKNDRPRRVAALEKNGGLPSLFNRARIW
jgi:hypothetical protein